MSKTDYMLWKNESLEQIQKGHPDWNKNQIQQYFTKIKEKLIEQGFLEKNW